VKNGNRLKGRMERGFTFLKMDVSINQLKGVEGGLTYPKGQGTDPFDQYSSWPRLSTRSTWRGSRTWCPGRTRTSTAA
jgi:hypothetical protein